MKAIISIFLLLLISLHAVGDSLTIYSSRKSHLVDPLLERFKKETGIDYKVVNGKAGALVERLKREAAVTPADLFLTVDAGNLWYAEKQGLFHDLRTSQFWNKVPSAFRSSSGGWVGLTLRSRTIFYNTDKVKPSELSTYEDLSSPRWRGKLCLRTSRKVYNQSLVASLISENGIQKTKATVKGWVANLARPVYTSDTLLLEAIARGECLVGIANTYYLARLHKKNKAKNVKVFWANQKKKGVHVNLSGGGILKSSKNKESALRLLSFFLADKGQKELPAINDEFPVIQGMDISELLKSWGDVQFDQRPTEVFGVLQKKSVLLMDSVGYR